MWGAVYDISASLCPSLSSLPCASSLLLSFTDKIVKKIVFIGASLLKEKASKENLISPGPNELKCMDPVVQ